MWWCPKRTGAPLAYAVPQGIPDLQDESVEGSSNAASLGHQGIPDLQDESGVESEDSDVESRTFLSKANLQIYYI